VTCVAEHASAEEARAFAETVAAIAARHVGADPWTPGAAVSDADARLDEALREAGWEELGRDRRLLALAGPAGAALGGAFASLAPIDRLLGGALCVGELARYASDGEPVVRPRDARLELAQPARMTPVPYTDALGVHRVELGDAEPLPDEEGALRMDAWIAASAGYLAGVTEEALRCALEHARSRRAFGGTLGSLEPVQQMLADAATAADGLSLLAHDQPGDNALAHAGEAAERAVAICMQVTGALGFTLEFPLQRAYRRTRAARAWADRVLLAWEPAES
jgi:3-oxo-4-pregnene-20-carboxyl-CoA dehydrogenase alpha subunit